MLSDFKWISVISALVFLIVILAIAIFIPNPTEFQIFVFRVVLALSAAAFGATIPGFLHVKLPLWGQGLIAAGGALALFVIIYQLNPPSFLTTQTPDPQPQIIEQDTTQTHPSGKANSTIATPNKLEPDSLNGHQNSETRPKPEKVTSIEGKSPEMIRATGISAPGQTKYAARVAAEADAKRKLAEAIHGALIEANTKVESGKLTQDEIDIRIKAILKHAKLVGSPKEMDDGSFEVVMEAPLDQ